MYARQRRLDQEARDYRKECVRTDETVVQATEILGGELIDVKLRVLGCPTGLEGVKYV